MLLWGRRSDVLLFDLLEGDIPAVYDGLPFGSGKQRGDAGRDAQQHEKREGEDVQQLFPSRTVDMPPFGRRGKHAQQKHGQAQPQKDTQQRLTEHRQRAAHSTAVDGRAEIDDGAQPAQNGGGHIVHDNIEAGEAAAEHPAHQRQPIAAKDLVGPLGPAHPLPPELPEAGRLLVIEDGVFSVADLFAAQDIDG